MLGEDIILPAAGQGAIAVTVRSGDTRAGAAVRAINHRDTFVRVQAERLFLGALTASCRFPLGVLASLNGDTLTLNAAVWSLTEDSGIAHSISGPSKNYEQLSAELAVYFKTRGIDEIVTC